MKILHIEPLRCNAATRQLLAAEGMGTDYEDIRHQEQLISSLGQKDYEALFVKLGLAYDATVFDAAPSLKYIVTPTTGLDHIDTVEAEKRGIQVLSLKGETAFLNTIKSTAEHTWAILLALVRNIPAAVEDVRKQGWRREPFLATELNGKKLGIIGYGRLGRMVAQYGVAFGMEVVVNDNNPAQLTGLPEGIQSVSLENLLAESQVISLHIPSNPANYHFIDDGKIALMEKLPVIINTSRGEVVDEDALLRALYSGTISGAAIDVIEGDSVWEDTIPADQPLLEYARDNDNLLITPHMGGYAIESIENTRLFMAQKFLTAFRKI
jgi:D-3-phosphoglycerate dehydrogenase